MNRPAGLPAPDRTGETGAIRIGDRERDEAVSALGDHFVAGRLTQQEFEERSDRATAARYAGDLRPLFADLPGSALATTDLTGPAWPPYAGWSTRAVGRVPAGGPPQFRPRPWFPLLPLAMVALVVVTVATGAPWLLWAFFWFALAGAFVRNRRRHRYGARS